MAAGFWLLLLCQWNLPELFWIVKCVIVETSSLVLLKIFPGTSLVAECGLCGGLVSHMCSCARGEVWTGCTILHGTAHWGNAPASWAALEYRWKRKLLLLQ